jgi:hypothetical protein
MKDRKEEEVPSTTGSKPTPSLPKNRILFADHSTTSQESPPTGPRKNSKKQSDAAATEATNNTDRPPEQSSKSSRRVSAAEVGAEVTTTISKTSFPNNCAAAEAETAITKNYSCLSPPTMKLSWPDTRQCKTTWNSKIDHLSFRSRN